MNRFEFHYESEIDPDEPGVETLVAILRLDDEGYESVDLRDLVETTKRDGDFWIFTCSCGVPECNGIYEGIHVSHTATTVRWRVPDPIFGQLEVPHVSHREFEFDRESYIAQIAAALAYAKQRVEFSPQKVKVMPYDLNNEYVLELTMEAPTPVAA